MKGKFILGAILIFLFLTGWSLYSRYQTFTLQINKKTYFYGNFACKLQQVRPTNEKVVEVSFHSDEAWISFRFSNKQNSGTIISFTKSDSTFLNKSFYFELENSGKTYEPKNNSVRLKINHLDNSKFRGELLGVIYDPLIVNDSLTISCKINSNLK